MASTFAQTFRRSIRAGAEMLSQIVVSVAAAVCVALITNAYLDRKVEAAAANVGLPALSSESIADLPVMDLGTPEAEIFPGVPADGAIASAIPQVQAAHAERAERMRLGLPVPYTPPLQAAAADAAIAPADGGTTAQ